jgi:hypothetical protein
LGWVFGCEDRILYEFLKWRTVHVCNGYPL